MSSDKEVEPVVVIEDEIEEGELSDPAPPSSGTDVKKVPRKYHLYPNTLAALSIRNKAKAMPRKGHTLVGKSKKNYKRYVRKLSSDSSFHKRASQNELEYVPSCRQVKLVESKAEPSEQSFDCDISQREGVCHGESFVQDFKSARESSKSHLKLCNQSPKKKNQFSAVDPPKKIKKFDKTAQSETNYTLQNRKVFVRNRSTFNFHDVDVDVSYEELLEKYKSIQTELAYLEEENEEKIDHEQFSSLKKKAKKHTQKVCDQEKNYMNDPVKALPDIKSEVKCEMQKNAKSPDVEVEKLDEDSELIELRRQALASLSKFKSKASDSSDGIQKSDNGEFVETENALTSGEKCSSAYSVAVLADNCEILDMDEDDLEESHSPSILSGGLIQNKNSIDMEVARLQAEILRVMEDKVDSMDCDEVKDEIAAEVDSTIASREAALDEKLTADSPVPSVVVADVKAPILNMAIKPDVEFQAGQVCKYKDEASSSNFHSKLHPSLLPFSRHPPLIINLAEDSSDSSDMESEAEELDNNKRAAIASLERLIDSAKNECSNEISQIAAESSDSQENACQTEAQPKLNLFTETSISKKKLASNKASLNAYTLLMSKLKIAGSMIFTENKILKMARTRLNERKRAFMTSQLEVRRLQEQLQAAVKVKDVNEQSMFEANNKLREIQSLVVKRATLIQELRKKCAKLELELFGEVTTRVNALNGKSHLQE